MAVSVLGVSCVVYEVPEQLPLQQVMAELRKDRQIPWFNRCTASRYWLTNRLLRGLTTILICVCSQASGRWDSRPAAYNHRPRVRIALIDTGGCVAKFIGLG